MAVIKELTKKEIATKAREDVKARLAKGFEAREDEILVDLSSGEFLVRDGELDIVVKVIVKTKRLEVVIEDEAEAEVIEEA